MFTIFLYCIYSFYSSLLCNFSSFSSLSSSRSTYIFYIVLISYTGSYFIVYHFFYVTNPSKLYISIFLSFSFSIVLYLKFRQCVSFLFIVFYIFLVLITFLNISTFASYDIFHLLKIIFHTLDNLPLSIRSFIPSSTYKYFCSYTF